MLNECGFDGDGTPIVQCSALGALRGQTQWEERMVALGDALYSYIRL